MGESHLDMYRRVIREHLVPLAIRPNEDVSEWVCSICRVRTPTDDAQGAAIGRWQARHSTYCDLGNALGAIE